VAIVTLATACSSVNALRPPEEASTKKTAVPEKPAPIVEPPVTLAAGTRIAARLTSTLSTKTATAGQTFTAELSQPLVVDGKTIAPRGSTLAGMVVEANPGGRVKGVAHITLRLTSIRVTPESEPVRLATNAPQFAAKTTKKKDGVMIGIASGVGAAIGALAGGGKGAAIGAGAGAAAGTGGVLVTRGDAAVIPAESVVTFTLREPISMPVLPESAMAAPRQTPS